MTTGIRRQGGWLCAALVAFGATGGALTAQEAKPKEGVIQPVDPALGRPVDFEKDVFPILDAKCVACHNVAISENGLILEDVKHILKGGKRGPSVVAKDLEKSVLYTMSARSFAPAMPPLPNKVEATSLTPKELGILKQWILEGATEGSMGMGKTIDWRPLPKGVQPVYSVAVSGDGQYVAAGRGNGVVVYHVPSGDQIASLTDPALLGIQYNGKPMYAAGSSHRDFVHSLAMSPNGRVIASGSFREVKLWVRPDAAAKFTFAGSPGPVTVATVSADDKWAATASSDNVVRLWNLADGQPGKTFAGHTAAVTSLVFSADGAKLISAGQDQTIRVWSVADGAALARIDTPAPVGSLTMTPDGAKIISGHADKFIRQWSVPAAAKPLTQPASAPPTLAVSPDKKLLAIPEADGKIKLLDLATGQIAKELAGHVGAVNSAKFGANGAKLISGGADGTVRVWDVATGQLVVTLFSGAAPVQHVALNAAGTLAAAGHANGQASTFKLDAAVPRPFPSDNGAPATVSALSRDGKQLATDGVAEGKPAILVRDIASGNLIKALVGHEGAVTALSFSADGTRLVSGSADKTARVWQIGEGKEIAKFAAHTNTVTAVAYTNDGNQVISGSADNSLKLWQVADAKELANFAGHGGAITAASYTAAAGQLVTGSADGTARIWTVANGQQAAQIGHGQAVAAIAVSQDTQKIAVAGTDNVVKVYQPNGTAQFTLTARGNVVKWLAMLADGTKLVAGSADNNVTVWDLATGTLVQSLPVPAGLTTLQFAAAAFPNVPTQLITGTADKALTVHTLNYDRSLVHPAMAITGMAFSPAGEFVYTTCEDGHFRRFNPADGSQQFAQNHGAKILDLAMSADGQWLATAGENNQTRVWNRDGGNGPQAGLAGMAAPVRSVAFAFDNEHIASGTADNKVFVHNLKTGQVVQMSLDHAGPIEALAAAGDDGKLFVVAAADKALKSFPLVAGLAIAGSNAPITGLALNPANPAQLWAAGEDGTIRGLDLNNGNPFRNMNHGAAITGIAVHPTGTRIATSGANGTTKLWNDQNQQVAELKGDIRAQALVARLTADDTEAKGRLQVATAAVPAAEKTLGERNEAVKKASEAKTKAETAATEAATKLTAATEAATAAKKAADDKKDDAALQKASTDAEKARTDAEAAAKKANEEKMTALNNFGQAEKDVQQATAALNKAKTDLEMATNRQKTVEAALTAAKQADTDKVKPLKSVAFSRNGKELAAGSEAGYIGRFDGLTGQALEATDAHTGAVLALGYTSTGLLLTAGGDNTAKLWTVSPEYQLAGVLGPKKEAPLDLHDSVFVDRVLALAFSPDGTLLATGGGDPSRSGELILWDVANRAISKTIPEAHSDTIFGIEFSRDGQFLLTGAADKFVKIFEVASGKHVKSFEGHTNHVLDVSWRADGQRIVSAGADNAIKVWNVELGEQERTIAGYAKQVTSIQYVGRANQVISCGGDKTVRFHTADNGGNFRNFAGATDFLYSVAGSENEQLIVAGGQDGVVRLWNAQNGQAVKQFDPPKEAAAAGQQAAK